MVTYEDLQILKSYESQGDGYVLSLYLNTDQAKATNLNRGFERALSNLFRSVEQDVTEPQARQEFERNRDKVWKFIQRYTPRKKTLLIFSHAAQDFWWDQEIPIDLPNLARFSKLLFLRPLIAALDEYERYGVVLIDQGHARLFTVYLGDIEEHERVFEEVPPVTQTAGRDRIIAQRRVERHHDEHVLWHAKNVAERLRDLTDRYRFDRLVIGGSLQAVAELQHVLPKPLRRLVVGTFPLPVQANLQDVLGETGKIETRVERETEEQLIDALITAAHKGEKATLGLADTIYASNEGRVWQLIYEKNFTSQGHLCSQCDMLYEDNRPEKCVYCGGTLAHTPNLVSHLIERVISSGGQVEEVRNQAAERLAQQGHIGAFLRY
jgi:peptide chain release factor subunit 1